MKPPPKLLGADGRDGITAALATATNQRAQVIGLSLVMGALTYGEHTSTETWRTPNDSDRRYLAALIDLAVPRLAGERAERGPR